MKSRLSKIVIFVFLVANLGMAEYIKKDNAVYYKDEIWQYNQNRLKSTAQNAVLKRPFSLKATAWAQAILSKYRKFVQNAATKSWSAKPHPQVLVLAML